MHQQLNRTLKPLLVCIHSCKQPISKSAIPVNQKLNIHNYAIPKLLSQRLYSNFSSCDHFRPLRVLHQLRPNNDKTVGLFPSGYLSRQKLYFHKDYRRHSKSIAGSSNGDRTCSNTKESTTWKFKLQNTFGVVLVETNRCVRVGRVDVLDNTNGDYATFSLRGNDSEMDKTDVEGLIAVEYDQEANRLNLVDDQREASPDEQWVLEIPPYYDLHVVHTGGRSDRIELSNLENQAVKVAAIGDIHLQNIKSIDVTLDSKEGDIASTAVLQGNLSVRTRGNKSFTADRLQGNRFKIQTEDGSVQCKDVYCKTSVISSQSGKINLGNVTGACSIETCGDVNVDGLDGSMDAKMSGGGSFTAYLVRPDTVSIKTEHGDTSLSAPPDVVCHLDLSACNITIPTELNMTVKEDRNLQKLQGALNGGGPVVTASSEEGSISLAMQSWFDSLKLGG